MKRRLLAMALCICTIFCLLPVDAAALDNSGIYVALGDSISTGYRLENIENAFPMQVAESNSFILKNLSKNGETSSGLLADLSASGSSTISAVQAADVITITIGGNDLMQALYVYLANRYNESGVAEYLITAEDVKNSILSADPLILYFALNEISGFASSKEAVDALQTFEDNLIQIAAKIRSMSRDALVILTTQYNPYSRLADQLPANSLMANQFKTISDAFESGVNALNEKISSIGSQLGFYISDVYTAFKNSDENPCNAFVSLSFSPSSSSPLQFEFDMDFHPNAYGHSLIAQTICGTLDDASQQSFGADFDFVVYAAAKAMLEDMELSILNPTLTAAYTNMAILIYFCGKFYI